MRFDQTHLFDMVGSTGWQAPLPLTPSMLVRRIANVPESEPFIERMHLRPDIYDAMNLRLKTTMDGAIDLPFPAFIAKQLVSVPIYRDTTMSNADPLYAAARLANGKWLPFHECRALAVHLKPYSTYELIQLAKGKAIPLPEAKELPNPAQQVMEWLNKDPKANIGKFYAAMLTMKG